LPKEMETLLREKTPLRNTCALFSTNVTIIAPFLKISKLSIGYHGFPYLSRAFFHKRPSDFTDAFLRPGKLTEIIEFSLCL